MLRIRINDQPGMVYVLHIGPGGKSGGGMAQVLSDYGKWPFSALKVKVACSTVGRRDPLSPLRWLRCASAIILARLRFKSSVAVVAHVSQGGSFIREGLLLALARFLGLRAAFHVHGSRFPSFARSHAVQTRTVLRLAHRVYVLTTESMGVALELGLDSSRVRIVRNGVALSTDEVYKQNIVLFAGEVGLRKGVDVLLKSWSEMGPVDGWQLLIVGPLTDGWSVTLQGSYSITYAGRIPRDDLLRIERSSAIAVLPSRDEALPVFLLEAMAGGCAVVSTPVGEIPTLLGDCGHLVPVDDHVALAAALRNLINDPVERKRMGDSARRRIKESYSAEVVSSILEEEWMELANS